MSRIPKDMTPCFVDRACDGFDDDIEYVRTAAHRVKGCTTWAIALVDEWPGIRPAVWYLLHTPTGLACGGSRATPLWAALRSIAKVRCADKLTRRHKGLPPAFAKTFRPYEAWWRGGKKPTRKKVAK